MIVTKRVVILVDHPQLKYEAPKFDTAPKRHRL
jgi:hypothetical protein